MPHVAHQEICGGTYSATGGGTYAFVSSVHRVQVPIGMFASLLSWLVHFQHTFRLQPLQIMMANCNVHRWHRVSDAACSAGTTLTIASGVV